MSADQGEVIETVTVERPRLWPVWVWAGIITALVFSLFRRTRRTYKRVRR